MEVEPKEEQENDSKKVTIFSLSFDAWYSVSQYLTYHDVASVSRLKFRAFLLIW